MPRKIRQLKADLRKEGCMMRPGKGSHTVWGHPLVPDTITLAGHDGDDAKDYQEKDVRDLLRKVRQAKAQQKR
jgi:predicted RNA binding protein YcfA (HicA-like mRNA interferase family)